MELPICAKQADAHQKFSKQKLSQQIASSTTDPYTTLNIECNKYPSRSIQLKHADPSATATLINIAVINLLP